MKQKMRLSESLISAYGQIHGLFDGTRGGLVLGKRHSEGGIKGIRESEVEKEYDIIFEMEGGEYLMNAMATEKCKKRLDEINSYNQMEPKISEQRIQSLHRIMDNRNKEGIILVSKFAQYIINRNATAKYLEELDQMNQDALNEYLGEHPEQEEKPAKPQRTTPRFQDEDIVSYGFPDEMKYKRTERSSTDKKK